MSTTPQGCMWPECRHRAWRNLSHCRKHDAFLAKWDMEQDQLALRAELAEARRTLEAAMTPRDRAVARLRGESSDLVPQWMMPPQFVARFYREGDPLHPAPPIPTMLTRK